MRCNFLRRVTISLWFLPCSFMQEVSPSAVRCSVIYNWFKFKSACGVCGVIYNWFKFKSVCDICSEAASQLRRATSARVRTADYRTYHLSWSEMRSGRTQGDFYQGQNWVEGIYDIPRQSCPADIESHLTELGWRKEGRVQETLHLLWNPFASSFRCHARSVASVTGWIYIFDAMYEL